MWEETQKPLLEDPPQKPVYGSQNLWESSIPLSCLPPREGDPRTCALEDRCYIDMSVCIPHCALHFHPAQSASLLCAVKEQGHGCCHGDAQASLLALVCMGFLFTCSLFGFAV